MSASNQPKFGEPNTTAPGEMIQVPNTLRAKVGGRFGGIDANALAKAEAALKGLSSQFAQWLQDEIDKLQAARAAIRTQGVTQETCDQLYLHAHDLKGLGTTYEFPLISRIAGSLCKLLDDKATRTEAPLFLVDAHIDAICAAVRDNIREVEHPVGRVLVMELGGQVAAYLAEHGRS